MPSDQKTDIPAVPVRTQFFDNPPGQPDASAWPLNRTWIIFFESLRKRSDGLKGPFQRTLLLKDTTVGNDIADRVDVYGAPGRRDSQCTRITGVLRKAITADLTLRIKNKKGSTTNTVGSFTIPMTTAVDTVVTFTTFDYNIFPDRSVFIWDVTASDSSIDAAGIASYTVEWQP